MTITQQHHDKMLGLVARGFYKELIKYGINEAQVLAVARHLLDNVLKDQNRIPVTTPESYNQLFRIPEVQDEWQAAQRLGIHQVSISPLDLNFVPQIASWLRTSALRDSFYPRYPDTEWKLLRYFQQPTLYYFSIFYQQKFAGIIGAEHIDAESGRLEMKKFVGDPTMHGKGIGKRATFLFLYHAFLIRKFRKVYLHSMEINIRNLNLNAKFGFELEGVLTEEALVDNQPCDILRMGLTALTWIKLFSTRKEPAKKPAALETATSSVIRP